VIRYSVLGLIFVIDQLLLPVFHIGGLPLKVSYIIVVLWMLDRALRPAALPATRSAFRGMAVAFGVLIGASILGEVWLSTQGTVVSYADTYRSIAIYVLMLFAFGLGQSASKLDFRLLPLVLLAGAVANLIFIFFGRYLPWLVQLYYDRTMAVDVLNFARPRGIFGNPNVSMLQINVTFLFAVLALRHKLLPPLSPPVTASILTLPLFTALALSTRAELMATVILWLAFIGSFRAGRGPAKYVMLALIVIPAAFAGWQLIGLLAENIGIIGDTLTRLRETGAVLLDTTNRDSSVLRPLLVWETVVERFSHSPVFGSGFSTLPKLPFEYSPTYFHNDWFRVLVTSGILGFGAMVFIVRRYCYPVVGLLGLLPFFLPGLVNTFLLAIPSVMFYFFMIGALTERLRRPAMAEVPAWAGPLGQPMPHSG
jgi:hypothetical protein